METSLLREQGNSSFSNCLTQYQKKNIDPSISGSQKLSRARVVLCCLQKSIAFWPAGSLQTCCCKSKFWECFKSRQEAPQEAPRRPPGGQERRAAGGKPSRRRPAAGGRPLDRLECHWPSFLFHFDRVGVVSRWPLPPETLAELARHPRPSRRLVQDMEY